MKKKTTKKKACLPSEIYTPTPNVDIGYIAIVNILGKNYKAVGVSISDAISNLNPGNCKGKGILTIKHGDVSKDRILMPVTVSRLFNSHGMMREASIKNVSNLFQGL